MLKFEWIPRAVKARRKQFATAPEDVAKHAHANHAMYAAFWRRWLAQLEVVCISRVGSGVVGVLQAFPDIRGPFVEQAHWG